MSETPQTHKIVIPDSLRRQLADFRRHLWRVKVIEAVAAGLIGLLVSFLLVYGLDRMWPTPGLVRLAILLGGVSLFVGFAPYWLHRWVWRQRRETQLARLIAKRYPGLGDRLLGVIELQNQEGSADSLSPRLREAAMEAVAAETGRRKLDDALPPQRHRKWGLAAMGLAGVVAATFALAPRAGFNALERWLMPLSNTERYTFTKLENPPTAMAVALGEAFDVTLKLAKESEQRPAGASGRYGLQPAIASKLSGNLYRFTFPGQQVEGRIVFKVGDLVHEMKVTPWPRPSVKGVRAFVSPPEYLGIQDQTLDLNTGVLTCVEGSKVRIEFEMDRALASGTYGPTRGETVEEPVANVPTKPGEAAAAPKTPAYQPIEGTLEVAGLTAKTPELEVGTMPFEIPFAWTDQLGLSGDSGFRVRVDALKDAAPTCYTQGVDRQKAILPEETVEFEVLAEDDFGLKGMGLEWTGQFTRPTDQQPAKGELHLGEGAVDERRMIRPAAFSPAAFGIAPQKITLRAYVEDRFPGRGRVYSEPVILYVLTRDEHAQMLKSQFDRQITELEDLARREQDLLDENQRIEKLDGAELQKDENRKRLEKQAQEETETKSRTQNLTERMEQLMKDAARNGDIDKKTLQKIAESLKSMQELSKDDVPKVEQKLGESQEQSNTPEKSQKDVKEAVQEQQKVVEKMKQAVDKANDANRRFEAGTFVNRLKKASGEQGGIVASLKEAFDRMLGLKTPALDPTDTRRLNDNARQQSDTASDVRWIEEDLAHYYSRTKEETFKAIMDEMRESQIGIGLENVRQRLAGNRSFEAAEEAKKWADKLMEWAKKLEGEKDKDPNGGGEGGGPDPEDEDFEFMLRVMKMIQQEQDLRARTRALEQLRRSFEATQPAKPDPSKP